MGNKSQFLKNNVMKVVTGGGGTINAAPGARGSTGASGNGAPANAMILGHGNSGSYKVNNKGSRSKLRSS